MRIKKDLFFFHRTDWILFSSSQAADQELLVHMLQSHNVHLVTINKLQLMGVCQHLEPHFRNTFKLTSAYCYSAVSLATLHSFRQCTVRVNCTSCVFTDVQNSSHNLVNRVKTSMILENKRFDIFNMIVSSRLSQNEWNTFKSPSTLRGVFTFICTRSKQTLVG